MSEALKLLAIRAHCAVLFLVSLIGLAACGEPVPAGGAASGDAAVSVDGQAGTAPPGSSVRIAFGSCADDDATDPRSGGRWLRLLRMH